MTPNTTTAHLSDTLFAIAIATYALAMVGFTAEYAFGRRGRIAATLPTVERAHELIGSGAPSRPDQQGQRADLTGSDITSSEPGTFADRAGRSAFAATLLGAGVHATSVAVRAVAVDSVPWSNMYEFASVAGLFAVLAFAVLMGKARQIRHLGGFILLPVILLMFLAGTVLYSRAAPLVPALQSYWLAIHVTLVSIAEGALMTSAVMTVLFMVKQRYERRADQPGRKQAQRSHDLGRPATRSHSPGQDRLPGRRVRISALRALSTQYHISASVPVPSRSAART